jgi:hypothetical protein
VGRSTNGKRHRRCVIGARESRSESGKHQEQPGEGP